MRVIIEHIGLALLIVGGIMFQVQTGIHRSLFIQWIVTILILVLYIRKDVEQRKELRLLLVLSLLFSIYTMVSSVVQIK